MALVRTTDKGPAMERVKLELEQWLLGVQVNIDPMRPGDKISGIIVWKGFAGLEPVDRYRLLWQKLRSYLSREDQSGISILITLAPAEYVVLREPQLA